MKKKLLLILSVFIATLGFGQSKSMLLLNGNMHPGNGEPVASAAIGIKNGKITLIKNSLAFSFDKSDWDTIIDLKGRHVYPGFIAPNSTLGLTEIDAVRATRDFDEVGLFNPHIRSQIAYNVESEVIATVKSNGVLFCQATPRGGVISGTSSVMALDGWNWEDATISANDGIHLNWPSSFEQDKENRDAKMKAEKYVDNKARIYAFFEAARAYASTKKQSTIDLRYDALKECFNGKKRVYIHANDLQQIQDLIDFSQHFQIAFPVIVGGYDAYLIPRKLKESKIPVMLFRPHSLPEREDDPIDLPFQMAYKLQEAGILFCLQNEGDMEAMNARNIPFLAGTTKAYGLTEEQAVASVSYNSCKIMGIDKEYGSIEIGKSATLFVSEGNALDMRTNDVVFALINGRILNLDNRQKQLYRKYAEKLSR